MLTRRLHPWQKTAGSSATKVVPLFKQRDKRTVLQVQEDIKAQKRQR